MHLSIRSPKCMAVLQDKGSLEGGSCRDEVLALNGERGCHDSYGYKKRALVMGLSYLTLAS